MRDDMSKAKKAKQKLKTFFKIPLIFLGTKKRKSIVPDVSIMNSFYNNIFNKFFV